MTTVAAPQATLNALDATQQHCLVSAGNRILSSLKQVVKGNQFSAAIVSVTTHSNSVLAELMVGQVVGESERDCATKLDTTSIRLDDEQICAFHDAMNADELERSKKLSKIHGVIKTKNFVIAVAMIDVKADDPILDVFALMLAVEMDEMLREEAVQYARERQIMEYFEISKKAELLW